MTAVFSVVDLPKWKERVIYSLLRMLGYRDSDFILVDLYNESTPLDNSKHDHMCSIYNGSCCPWLGDCECQCTCDIIAAIRADERASKD